ncbi:glutaredoxin family protein [Spirulina sp. CCNP1310]|uniref:glutaredoxin family protein n=1 Tax=Spirulina sp. CCNP1310 TaxID=3110249 RepID=UPI002B20FFDC|nr:glutaredoxin family protein [Spirulina sp. CCNP1310]MEA5418302.1 glutaredoxin family protein [Spirulina sp. CCNP1310]
MHLILYSKPGCHLCIGLEEKLAQVTDPPFTLEVRDITTDDGWFAEYEYTIPVLTMLENGREIALPRFSPRASVAQVAQMLKKLSTT